MFLPKVFTLAIFCVTGFFQNAYGDAIVYDYSTPTYGPGLPLGFYPLDKYSADHPAGNEITLGGTDRYMTGFDLFLSSISSTQPTILGSLTLKFYLNNGQDGYGYDGAPGDAIDSLTTTITNVSVQGVTRVPFTFPPTLMPDDFTWIIVADSSNAGFIAGAKTIGDCPDYYWDLDNTDDQWYAMNFGGSPPASFEAVVYAVPEPMTLSLLGLAGSLLVLRRSRCRQ